MSQKISQKNDRESDFDRIFWFVEIMKWIQRPHSDAEKGAKKETVYTVRLKYLLQQLSKNPEWKSHFISNITLLLSKISSPSQLSSAGLPETTSFIQEFVNRLQEKILPQSPLSEDLSTLIYEIFPTEDESLYIDFIEGDVLEELFSLFKADEVLSRKLRSDLLAAAYILNHQILGYSLVIQKEIDDINARVDQLYEFKLEGALRDLQNQPDGQVTQEVFSYIDAIESHVQQLFQKMKLRGVKIDLVYLFQLQRRKINRLHIIMKFLDASTSKVLTFRYFVSQLVLEIHHQKSLISFFSENLTLLTNRIVQTNSHVGEHYVTFTWTQFRKMFQSALGGGAVTSVTVMIKQLISFLGLSGFLKGLADSFNYSGSFLAIQMMGFTLATKQPSATAPYIASALQKSVTESKRAIVALLRTQFIAVLGNLSFAFPMCFLFAWSLKQLGYPFLTKEESMYMFYSTNILGPSAVFAVFTGVLLFLASLFAGWFENWMLVNRVNKRIKYNGRLQRIFGVQRIRNFAESLVEKANPLAANIGLGFLLGMSPQILKFFNIPLDVRHVTLATGGFAASLPMAIEHGVTAWDVINASSGILLIGTLNLSVSFTLAFLLASISSKVRISSFVRLLKWGFSLILTRPWLLIIPEKQEEKNI